MWNEAKWLGVPGNEIEKWNILEGDLTGRFAYYRCEAEIPAEHAKLEMDITANSRYRLWINGKSVLSGPCKGDRNRHYYDRIQVADHLVKGKNVFAVQVLYCNPDSAVLQTDERASIFGVVTPGGGHRLAVEGDIRNEAEEILGTVTTGKADWRVYLDGSYYLKSNEITVNLGAVCEEIDFRKLPSGWKNPDYSMADWSIPSSLEGVVCDEFMKSVGLVQRFQIKERCIPFMYEKEDSFAEELHTSRYPEAGILREKKLSVPAGETRTILLDAGIIKNGYPVYRLEGGSGSKISFTYFEKFVNETRKIRRDDSENGEIVGLTDVIVPDGGKICYEPFWYRTFRFVRICIQAAGEDVLLYEPVFKKTGYPLEAGSWVRSSRKWVEEVWEMCVHTLENCMMETYMDCPYYEQMQFPMDTRLQAMFHYIVDTDPRLAKKALEDFHCSIIPEGLIQGKYPSAYCQVISTFSLHYIYMLEEYYRQTGDLDTVKRYFPDIDGILGYYDRKIEGHGLVGRLGFWEFADWQDAWQETRGVPAALAEGPSTIINLMYGYALLMAANVNEAAGRTGMAEEYRARQRELAAKLDALCWDEERGMYREGPGFEQFTQHAQAWAVLNGLKDRETRRSMLKNAIAGEDVMKCSFSTAFEWFRALENAGLYAKTEQNMMRWAGLKDEGCTTCPEEPEHARSDNHAWSALPIYELIGCMAGIRCGAPGWESVRIEPHLEYLPDLEGEAVTPRGKIRFAYQQKNGKWNYRIELPDGLDGSFTAGDGSVYSLTGGRVNFFEETRERTDEIS